MIRRTERERAMVAALVELLGRNRSALHISHHPDEERSVGNRPKAPDYLFAGPDAEVMIEVTELATAPSDQFKSDLRKRTREVLRKVHFPAGTYQLQLLTHDDRKIRRLVESGELQSLVDMAIGLTVTPVDSDAAFRAFFRRDRRYCLWTADQLVMVSKLSEHGPGHQVIFSESPAPTGSITIDDPDSPNGKLSIPTTHATLRPQAVLAQTLMEILAETNAKFRYRESAQGILLLDVHSYAGPLNVLRAIGAMPVAQFDRITDVWLVVNEPYSDPPLTCGEVCGGFRFWSRRESGVQVSALDAQSIG